MLGILDSTCEHCMRVPMAPLPHYLRAIQTQGLHVNMNTVGMAQPLPTSQPSRSDAEHGLRVLVLGPAKTGTTIISHSIRNSMPNANYSMEPRDVGYFENIAADQAARVVKILFGHWRNRPRLLDGIVMGEAGFVADRTIAIVRDPRDNAISSMFYSIYEMVLGGAEPSNVEQWIKVIERKQQAPKSLSMAQMLAEMNRIFGSDYNLQGFVANEFIEYSRWIASHREHLHILRYEDFIAGRLEMLEQYLGFPLTRQRYVPEGVQRIQRSSGSGSWRHLMLPSDVELLRAACGDIMAAHGYGDWTLANTPHLDPAHGTEYVRRISEEAFQKRKKPLAPATKPPPAKPIWPSKYRYY